MEKIFVYGTLMTGFENNHLLSNSELLGKAITADKYKMTARFIPYLTKKDGDTHIFGEVYEVDEQTLRSIDNLEGHPNWYKREQIPIMLKGSTILAWCYLNEEKTNSSFSLIESGNYYEYRFTNEKRKSAESHAIMTRNVIVAKKDKEIKELKNKK